ncbi:MAG: FAD/NAD(P)-binding protein, partial [Acidobacteriota bacterium]
MPESSLPLEAPAPRVSPPAAAPLDGDAAAKSARRGDQPDGQLDVVIIGGGIHGVHLAARFVGEVGLVPERLVIVDPGPSLLERWRTFTAVTGMIHLRSPGVHNIDVEPFSLIKDAGRRSRRPRGVLFPPYDLPALDFFNQHCLGVIERHGLADRHLRGLAVEITPQSDHVRVGLDDGRSLEARRVVLA